MVGKEVESEYRKFQTRWESEYFFTELKGKICTETVAVMKEYNVQHHYKAKHQANAPYTAAEREQKAKQMVATLQGQQQYFFVLKKSR